MTESARKDVSAEKDVLWLFVYAQSSRIEFRRKHLAKHNALQSDQIVIVNLLIKPYCFNLKMFNSGNCMQIKNLSYTFQVYVCKDSALHYRKAQTRIGFMEGLSLSEYAVSAD